MNTPASAVVPSREAVEEWCNLNGEMLLKAARLLRALLAEVERLTNYVEILLGSEKLAKERHAETRTTVAQLERTAANQAAALAERDKDAERYRWLKAEDEKTRLFNPKFGQTLAPANSALACISWKNKAQQWCALSPTEDNLDGLIDAALAASVSTQEEK